MKTLLIFLISLLISINLLGNNGDEMNNNGKYSLMGKVVNPKNQPIEYANVGVYKQADSTLVSGGITDASGLFEITGLKPGKYYLEVQFLGYNKKIVPSVEIKEKAVNVGSVTLSENTLELEGVEIRGERTEIVQKIDRKVITVGSDIAVAGGNATNVLMKLPSVSQDMQGNISFRGSQNFKVLIDGRPTNGNSNDILKQIPIQTIDRIEVISNPSAKYTAEGSSGIINVILKKQKVQGLNAVVNGSIALNGSNRINANTNYKMGKVNYFANASYEEGYSRFSNTYRREQYGPESTIKRDMQREFRNYNLVQDYKLGAEIDVTEKDFLSVNANLALYGFATTTRMDINETTLSNSGETSSKNLFSYNKNATPGDKYTGNLNYQHSFSEHSKISMNNFYSLWVGKVDYLTRLNTPDLTTSVDPDFFYNHSTDDNVRHHYYQMELDYENKLGKNGKIELGYHFRYDNRQSELIVEGTGQPSDLLNLEYGARQGALYRRDINALYSTYSGAFKKFEYKLGLRGEFNFQYYKNQATQITYPDNWFRPFPTVHLGYALPKEQMLSFSYSKRVTRPNGWNLYNLPTYQNRYNAEIGNPYQKPEHTHSFELGYQKRLKTGFLSTQLYHRDNSNVIGIITTLDENGVSVNTRSNISKSKFTGLESSLNLAPLKWLDFNLGVNLFRFEYAGKINEVEKTNSSHSAGSRLALNFKLTKTTKISLTHIWDSGQGYNLQSSQKPRFFAMLSASQKVLKEKGEISLFIWDLYKSVKFEDTVQGDGFKDYNKYYLGNNNLFLSVGFSYTFNDYRPQKASNSKNNINESSGSRGSGL